MFAGSLGGMSKYLKLFYFAPMAVFCLIGVGGLAADATGTLSNVKTIPDAMRLVLWEAPPLRQRLCYSCIDSAHRLERACPGTLPRPEFTERRRSA